MGHVLQPVWALEALCDTSAENDLKIRIKTQLGKGWSTRREKVTRALLRQEAEYVPKETFVLCFPFPGKVQPLS